MEIKVFDNTVEVHWLGKTEVTDNEYLVSMYKDADERERRRITVNFFDTDSFRLIAVDEPKPKHSGSHGLTDENYRDLARYMQDDDFGDENNSHWIVE